MGESRISRFAETFRTVIMSKYLMNSAVCLLRHPKAKNVLIRTINSPTCYVKELVDSGTQKTIFRGTVDDEGRRTGQGVEFDVENDKMILEGIWIEDELKKVLRIFENEEMTEFDNSRDNLDVMCRVPVYNGGYYYDKNSNRVYRDGVGYIINNDGEAISKGVWEKGVEKEITSLTKGWHETEKNVFEQDENLEEIVIPGEEYKEAKRLELNKYKNVVTIEIGRKNFIYTDRFNLNGLEKLESVRIGRECFYIDNRTNRMNRIFSVMDCSNLRTLIIDTFSFFYYSGGFELRGLPSLEVIEIGKKDEDSYSFCYSNFILKGML